MAMLVETAHHRLLYDAGPRYSLDSNGGNRTITPYLKARGIGALDAMVISHSDADHAGGALAVLGTLPVALLLSSLDERHPIVRKAARAQHCMAGQAWDWDGVHFAVLHPTADSYDDAGLKTNARSCTLRITAGAAGRIDPSGAARPGATLLAAGDIEAAQEGQLLARRPDRPGTQAGLTPAAGAIGPAQTDGGLAADVLLAPHHGSGTSSTPAFLAAVHPAMAIFQVGYRNRYHHPKSTVWQRYGDAGIARLRTDDAGAITLRFGAGVSAESYRVSHARYWYGQ
jgi:competence protein ComEC